MSWSNFNNQVRTRGLARTNRYRAVIPFPTLGNGNIQLAELFCDSVTLPGINIATTPQRVFGEVREMPYEKIYDAVQMTFYVDSQMIIKSVFDQWLSLVINPDSRTVQYYNSYIKDIELYVVNVDQSTPYKLTLYEAYPKTISPIQMSAESRELMKLTVSFSYKYWKASSAVASAQKLNTNSRITPQSQGSIVSPSF